jgi:hypothetical protein
MRTLIKLAVGAAIAGALVNLLRQRSGRTIDSDTGLDLPEQDLQPDSEGFTVEELAASAGGDTPATSTQGQPAGQPPEWGGGKSGLN